MKPSHIPCYCEAVSAALELLEELSRTLNRPTDELLRQGLRAFLERELRLIEEDIADLREKYSAGSRSEMEARIRSRQIASHPAWEDLIAWENAEAYAETLKDAIKRIPAHL